MSFIYAKNINNKLYILADSKLSVSSKDEAMLIKAIGSENYNNIKSLGIIKNVIINNNICIASAGILEDYNELLLKVDENSFIEEKKICSIALDIHLKNNQRTDFIIAKADSKCPVLYEIKNGKISETATSWIGSYTCFSAFQSIRNNPEFIQKLTEYMDDKMKNEYGEEKIDSHAFEQVVNLKIDNSVGGSVIECKMHNGKFRYNECLTTCTEKPHALLPGGIVKLYDNVSDGGYTCHVYQSSDYYKMYILQLKKGIIFEPHINDKNYNHLRLPKIYDLNEDEFLKLNYIENLGLIIRV